MFKNKYILIIVFLLSTFNLCYSDPKLNYSEIATHPRILLSEIDIVKVKEAINSNSQLKNIHNHIMTMSDGFLTKEVLVYEKTGKRLLAVSREALNRIFFLSYAYRMTEDDKYLHKAEVELNSVCDFPDWNPSHFLDVAEMTMAVAIGYDWLYNNLNPTTKNKIEQRILNYAFASSNQAKYNGFLNKTDNWNQVCNAGLIYGALAIFEKYKTESIEIIERSIQSNYLALEGYSPDGNYPEGAGYWGYGTSFQVMLIAALESAFGTDIGLSQIPGFLQSAEYMMFVNGPTRLRFNYSDCSKNQSANIPMFWFARKTNNPNLLYDEMKLIDEGLFLRRLDENRILPALLVFAHSLDLSYTFVPSQSIWSGDGVTPVVLVRTDWTTTDSEYLGIKGGSATTGHAHMDAGTFVYDSEGLRWAMDFGLQSYITLESLGMKIWNMTQNSERWDVFRYNNKNHNTITINDKNHKVDGRAHLIETYDTDIQKGAKFDLTEVFFNDVESAIRKAVIKENKYLEIKDEISTKNQEAHIRWTMVTPADIEVLDSNTFELTQKGKKKIMSVVSEVPLELKIWNSENPGTEHDALNPGTIMIGFESIIPKNTTATYSIALKSQKETEFVKRDFLSGYKIGDNVEKGTYQSTNESEIAMQNQWMYRFGSVMTNTKITPPLVYDGYIESGVDSAFEITKLSNGSATLGYSLADSNKYNSGSYYLAFMININNNLDINATDRTRNMIGFSTKYTLDLARIVLSVSKGGSTSGFKFGIGERHSANAGTYPMSWSKNDYNFNQTYLAILKYDFNAAKASLFINPTISEEEPSPLLEISLSKEIADANISRGFRAICIEQSKFDSRKIGGIRFSNTWDGAIGSNSSTSKSELIYNKNEILSEKFYNLSGILVTKLIENNIYIKRTIYKNGTIKSEKIVFIN